MESGSTQDRTLSLSFVGVSVDDIKKLLSSCPELEKLTLDSNFCHTHIEVSNPKLKYLCIRGGSDVICLNDLRLLVRASFHATSSFQESKTRNFGNSLGSILGIQELCLGGYYLKSLAVSSNVSRRLPYTFDHLKNIMLMINVKDMKKTLAAIRLLMNSSPNLQKLQINLLHEDDGSALDLLEPTDTLKSTFNKLRAVVIYGFLGTKVEFVLVKLILLNSSVLERMEIHNAAEEHTNGVLKELLLLKRVSPWAEIVAGSSSPPGHLIHGLHHFC